MKNINDLLKENRDSTSAANGQALDDSMDEETPPVGGEQPKVIVSKSVDSGVEERLEHKMEELRQKEVEDELKSKAQKMGVGYINLKGTAIPGDILQRVSLANVKEHAVICFYYAPHKVARLATTKSGAGEILKLKEDFKPKLGVEIEIFLTSEESFKSALKIYESVPKIKEVKHGVEIGEADLEKFSDKLTSLASVAGLIKEVSTTELVALIIAAGLKTDASDIHVEAEEDGIKLRYRIDGVLHTAAILGREAWNTLIARLKLLSNLKLNIIDKPQDGRFSIFAKEEKVDVRVSTLPTNYGESVVMRLLMSKVSSLGFEDLGLNEGYFKLLAKQIKRPNGMIITTGPTGSGKTTTLYAVLNKLNSSETKIITIEDPIEYELEGINQSQVEPEKDYTFARGLRSLVRQDPDIIMVGEMRDLETVEIALNAALTGHLVLSTLHTNDAAGAIPRFLAMGAKPYLLAPALNLVMAQRLVRLLCKKCKKEIKLDEATMKKLQETLGDLGKDMEGAKFYGPGGCEACNELGYKGRVGIFEMFEMNKEIADSISAQDVSEYKIREIAVKNGMRTMVQDGLLKAMQGVTSVEEVFRVTE